MPETLTCNGCRKLIEDDSNLTVQHSYGEEWYFHSWSCIIAYAAIREGQGYRID